MSNKKEEQRLIADKVSAAVKPEIVFDNGTSSLDKEHFIAQLPEDISAATVRRVFSAATDYTLGVLKAGGEAATEKFVDDPSLDKLVVKADLLGLNYNAVYNRKNEFRNPSNGEQSVKYLGVRDSLTIRGVGKGGLSGEIRSELSERAAKLLAE